MTPKRETEQLQAKIIGLQSLLADTADDPLAAASLKHTIAKAEARLKELADKPPINPQAELFFSDGVVTNANGLEITFAADMLKSYQNMVTNHYAAKHYGTLRKSGRRHGESEAHLFLTALPHGSFGMQLSQPHITDFFAAANVSGAMEDLIGLVDSAAESDTAFDNLLVRFNPRVLKPLTEFMKTLNAGGGSFRLVTGFKEVKMNREKVHEAYLRVSAVTSEPKEVSLLGTFGGITGFTWEFDFQPNAGEVIHGPISNDVTEAQAEQMNHDFMYKPAVALLLETTVTTRSGKKKPTYELIGLKAIKETTPVKAVNPAPATAPAPTPPATPPKELPPTPPGPSTKAVRPKLPTRVPPPKAAAPTPAPVTPPPPAAPKVQPKTPPKTEPPTSETPPPAPDKK